MLVSDFPLLIEGNNYMISVTYDFRVKILQVKVLLDGKQETIDKISRPQDKGAQMFML